MSKKRKIKLDRKKGERKIDDESGEERETERML